VVLVINCVPSTTWTLLERNVLFECKYKQCYPQDLFNTSLRNRRAIDFLFSGKEREIEERGREKKNKKSEKVEFSILYWVH